MTHGSLFTGIGGFDLAAQWAGIENVFQVEIDKFCQKVLQKNFPNTKKYLDIKEFDGTEYRGRVDIVSGGFPCQPFSIAGKRKGKEDDRYLWNEMLRVIRELKPKYVVGENVANLWNMGIENMLVEVENEGYEVESFIIPACAVGAPHRRDRVWIFAYTGFGNEPGEKNETKFTNAFGEGETIKSERSAGCDELRIAADSDRTELTRQCARTKKQNTSLDDSNVTDSEYGGCNTRINTGEGSEVNRKYDKENRQSRERPGFGIGQNNSNASDTDKFNGNNGGFSTSKISQFKATKIRWDENWIQVAVKFCRVDDGISDRVDRLKSLGNAIVPQIAYIIFEAIKEVEAQLK